MEGCLAGLEVAQGENIRRLSLSLNSAIADAEAALQVSVRSEVSQSLEPVSGWEGAAGWEVGRGQRAKWSVRGSEVGGKRVCAALQVSVGSEVLQSLSRLAQMLFAVPSAPLCNLSPPSVFSFLLAFNRCRRSAACPKCWQLSCHRRSAQPIKWRLKGRREQHQVRLHARSLHYRQQCVLQCWGALRGRKGPMPKVSRICWYHHRRGAQCGHLYHEHEHEQSFLSSWRRS